MSDEKKYYANISVTAKEGSEVEITGEIPAGLVPSYRASAIKKLGENLTVDGFRKGHVPEKILVERLGEDVIMGEAAELALQDAYPQIIRDQGIRAIGRPKVLITKLALGNPIGFTIESAALPEVRLADYKKAAAEVMGRTEDTEVTDADVEQVLLQVRRGRARYEKAQAGTAQGVGTPDKIEQEEEKEEDLPLLDDSFVQTLGNFKTVDDFKVHIRDDVKKDKESKARDRKRVEMSEKLIEGSSADVPNILIESELDKMTAQTEDDVARVNLTFDDYLAHIKKTREDLRKEWRDQAVKRAKLQLILNEIAAKESIHADHDEVHREMDRILEHYKDADRETVHIFVENQLQNEAVFAFLESAE